MHVQCPACELQEIDFGYDIGPARMLRRIRTCRRCGAFVVLDERTHRVEVIRSEPKHRSRPKVGRPDSTID